MKCKIVIRVWRLLFALLFGVLHAGYSDGSLCLRLNQQTAGIELAVNASEDFTNRVEIYFCTNLNAGIWNIAAQDIRYGSTNQAVRIIDPAYTCFYKAGNMDIDSDFDGVNDAREIYIHRTSPDRWDSDGDWIPDNWEIDYSLNALISDGILDSDRDGLSNRDEYRNGTNPFNFDSDGDGMSDLWEVNAGTDPLTNDAEADPDSDGLVNYDEYAAATNPLKPDTDDDGILDGFEVHHGMKPRDPLDVFDDLDGDLVPNFYEYIHGSDSSDSSSVPVPTAVVSTNGHGDTYASIQDAANAVGANEYPIILVESGNYRVEAEITLTLSNVLIYAAGAGTAVLDGGASNRLFSVISGRPIIAGLMMKNGYSADNGGAVYVSSSGPSVRNCLFQSNRSDENGGAIYADSYALEVLNCVFNNNDALNGGAVYCADTGTELINCTCVDNHAIAQGGAICGGSIINGIIWSNRTDSSSAQITGAAVSYSCVEGGCAGISNTANNPRLLHGWHLASAASPCVDSGSSANAPIFDLNNELRDHLPDIGADEWVDSDLDGLPDWWEWQWFGSMDAINDGSLPANDSDGRLSYLQKYVRELNPGVSDYDGDGLSDYAEIYIYKTDPFSVTTLDRAIKYTIEKTGYDWIDITQTGQAITNFRNLDDGVVQIPVGFQFPFSGATYDTVYVCNNGFVSFGGASTEYDNKPLPSSLIPEKSLCVFWDDFRMGNDSNAAVYVQTGTARCVISFEKFPFWSRGLTNRLSFQIVMENDGRILYQYKTVSTDGSLPTIGAQWCDGNVEFYAGGVTNNTALLILNATGADIDLDGVCDAWETRWFGNLSTVTNGYDFASGSNRFTFAEAAYLELNPNSTDTDGDGLSDRYEVENGMNPVIQQDTDADGMPDFFETANGLNPSDPSDALLDPDGDGFPNVYEYKHGTDFREVYSVPLPDRYVALSGQHLAPFTNRATAATNIQAALAAAAAAYDIIQIADGVYTGNENRNLNISGKPLMLLAANGPTNCIIDCENAGRGLSVIGSATGGSVVRGIQFFRGYSDWGFSDNEGFGGAVYCENTWVLFENCRIRASDSSNRGGAMYGQTSSAVFKDCAFESNGGNSVGGACYFEKSSFVKMLGCTVTETLGEMGVCCFGSGLLIRDSLFSHNFCCTLYGDSCAMQIENSRFSDNNASRYGGGAYFYDADVIFSNCVFRNNSVESSGWGAGAICQEHTELNAQNCLFTGNGAEDGVIYVQSGSARLQNCTIVSNQSLAICRYYFGDITVRNTVLWGNTFGSYNSDNGLDIAFSCLPEAAGTNNISENPKLITATGELLPDSPCIDRGSDIAAPSADLLGTPRWDHYWRNNSIDSSITDIGVVEFSDNDVDADGLGDKWEIYYFAGIAISSGADDDEDGLSTLDEYKLNTNPILTDTDGDTLDDGDEVVAYRTNPRSSDSDEDGLCDADEINIYGTDPLLTDSDGDGLTDGWEVSNGLNPLFSSDASADEDNDGLSNLAEYSLGTDFQKSDSDNDGMPDAWEVANRLNPLVDDSASDNDSDGVGNLAEYLAQTDPEDTDNDNDGMPNAWESAHGLNLAVDDALGDPDGDGLTNLEEYKEQTDPQSKDTDSDRLDDKKELRILHTSPRLKDTDGDGVDDWFELDQGRDPLTNESDQPVEAIMEISDGGVKAMTSSYSGSIPASDFDDDGQLTVDELHRYPRIVVIADTHYASPSPQFLFNEAVVKEDTRWVSVAGSGTDLLYAHAKEFYGEPGRQYGLNEILDVANFESHPVLSKGVWLSSHFSWSGGTPDIPLTASCAGTYLYPYACTYRIETAVSGARGRKMSININDDDDNGDGISDCNDESINGSADINDMGLVVFEQIVIHSNAPTPHIYLSASQEVRLFRASNGHLIRAYRHGEPWSGEAEDIGNELRNGDLAVLVEGILPSSAPSQTADNTVDGWPYIPPYYGIGDPTSQGAWGTYVGLYCKDDVDRYPVFENDMVRFSVQVKPGIHLIPDWNRDRQINNTDSTWNTNGSPYRFWINDDSDSGDIAEGDSDIPGQGSHWNPLKRDANYTDKKVNGRSDLTDFFPVWLDISSALTVYPPSNGITYKLHYPLDALHFVYTDLTRSHAGDYLITDVASCGPSFCQNVSNADTVVILQNGIDLNSAFLDRIVADPDKGVLLIEATKALTAPLLLTIVSNGTILASCQLPLSLSGVEDMFRHKNLRAEIGGSEAVGDRNTAPNWPDSLCSTTNLFFLHGFNTSEMAARAWQAEMFKRFYWAGSDARFFGITWCGDKGREWNYQANVNNAFETAPLLNQYVSTVNSVLGGKNIMLAHSLGNMVVSSAMEDYGMNAGRYLMLDAAVSSEAYDASLFNAAANNNPMLHADWRGYKTETWSASFHDLYSSTDMRAKLTWKGRFASVVPKAYNFYSSEDEVLEINPLSLGLLTGAEFDTEIWLSSVKINGLERYAWHKQEVLKGRMPLAVPLPTSLLFGYTKWWGWGFHWGIWPPGQTYLENDANMRSPDALRKDPVFRHCPDMYVHVDTLTTSAVNEMLAMGLPAMSPPVGQTSVAYFNPVGQPPRNTNISTLKANGWPRNHPLYGSHWLHSDCKDVAYLYTYKLFDKLTTEGGLK